MALGYTRYMALPARHAAFVHTRSRHVCVAGGKASGAGSAGIRTHRTEMAKPFDIGEDGGASSERAPFLPSDILMPGQPLPRARSQLMGRIEGAVAVMLRHGCGRQVLMLAIIFTTILLVMEVFVLPVMDPKDRARLKVPNSLAEVQEVYQMLGDYKAKHYSVILLGFTFSYLAKQAFALPGAHTHAQNTHTHTHSHTPRSNPHTQKYTCTNWTYPSAFLGLGFRL